MILMLCASTHRAHINVIVDQVTREMAIRVEVGIVDRVLPMRKQKRRSAVQ